MVRHWLSTEDHKTYEVPPTEASRHVLLGGITPPIPTTKTPCRIQRTGFLLFYQSLFLLMIEAKTWKTSKSVMAC